MKFMAWSACLIPALLLVGCGERPAQSDPPKTYNQAGLEFAFPGNWAVTEDVQDSDVRYLFVETPGEAIIAIQAYPPGMALELREFAETFARSTRESTTAGDISDSTFTEVQESDGYETLTDRFSIALLGVNVPHTRTYYRKEFDGRVCYILLQVADEDSAMVTSGFEEIVSSFKYEAP